jgi:DNA-binding transcriptional regulator YbjK
VYIYWLVYIEVIPKPSNPTRERIISAASSLFYNEGIRAVSVDAVAAKAGLTKRTLHYHFRSKDDLVAAYLPRSRSTQPCAVQARVRRGRRRTAGQGGGDLS